MSNIFSKIDDTRPYAIWEGITARVVQGDRVSMAVVHLEADRPVPEHRHPNEQIGVVLRGTMRFTINGETRDLVPGDTYVIPPDVPHDALTGPGGCVVMDVFAPPRADWEALGRLEPSPSGWPGGEVTP